ncbi:RNA polymerase sigma factor [Inquilinus sp. CAU 1745]|uniref:RNA polymerase sigma factor n=1 Tax=Inquilinus sp. CAU 1745 TaxID=3140369 RepID=UPI00325B0384
MLFNDAMRREMVVVLPKLRRFAYGLTGSIDEGDDLVQAACERALSRAHQWRSDTRLDSWMYKIVQNLWIDRIRRDRRLTVVGEDNDLDVFPGGDAGDETEQRLLLGTVRDRIAVLPPDQRNVLLLITVEGISYKEAAAILDIPIGTVMSRLARARIALGKALDTAPAVVGV